MTVTSSGPGNWSSVITDGVSVNDHIIINHDVTLDGHAPNVKSLVINSGKTLTGGGYKITFSGENGSGFVITNDGDISGNLDIEINTQDTTSINIGGSAGNCFRDLKINHASTVLHLHTNTFIDGQLTIAAGELKTFTEGNSQRSLTLDGSDISVASGAKLTINDSQISSRKLTSSGTLTGTGGKFTVTGAGLGNTIRTIDLGGTISGNVDAELTGAGNNRTEDLVSDTAGSLRNVIINNAAAVVKLGRDTTIGGTFTVTAGTLDTENHDLATGSTGHLNGNGTIKTGSGDYSTGGAWSIANTQLQVDGGTFDIGRSNDESMGGNWDCNNVSATIATHKFSPTINMTNGTGLVSGNTAEKIIVTATSLGTANVYGPLQGRINLVTNSSGSKDFVLKEDLTVNGRIVVSGSGQFRTYDGSNTFDLLVDGATQHSSNNGSSYSCLDVIDSAKFLSGSSSVILDAALGSNLCDIGEFNGTDGQAVTGWTAYGNNTIVYDSNSAKITYVDNGTGAFFMLNSTALSNSGLTIGKVYKATFDAKINTGSVNLKWTTQSGSLPFGVESETHAYLVGDTSKSENLTNTSYEKRVAYFVAGLDTSVYLYVSNMSSGEVVHIDNMTVQEVMANGSTGSAGHKMSYGLDVTATSTACDLGTGFYYSCGTRFAGQNHTKASGRFCAGSGDSTEYFSGGGNTLDFNNTDIILLTNSGATTAIGFNLSANNTTWNCRGFYFYASNTGHWHGYWNHASAPTINSPSSSTATKLHTIGGDLFILKGMMRTQYPAADKYAVGLVVSGDVKIYNGGTLETHQDDYNSGIGDADHSFGSLTVEDGGTWDATSKITTITKNSGAFDNRAFWLHSSANFNHNYGTVKFTGSNPQVAPNSTGQTTTNNEFYNLEQTNGRMQWKAEHHRVLNNCTMGGSIFNGSTGNVHVLGICRLTSGETFNASDIATNDNNFFQTLIIESGATVDLSAINITVGSLRNKGGTIQ